MRSDDPDDLSAGAIAAKCFRAAEQLRGGPVRDALLAMGREYAARARDGARGAAVRIDAKRASQTGGALASFLRALVEPLPQRRMATIPAMMRSQPVARPVEARPAKSKRFQSRLFRYSNPL